MRRALRRQRAALRLVVKRIVRADGNPNTPFIAEQRYAYSRMVSTLINAISVQMALYYAEAVSRLARECAVRPVVASQATQVATAPSPPASP